MKLSYPVPSHIICKQHLSKTSRKKSKSVSGLKLGVALFFKSLIPFTLGSISTDSVYVGGICAPGTTHIGVSGV